MEESSKNQNQLNTDKIFITTAIIFGLSLLFFIAWISQLFNLSLSEFIFQFKGRLFYPNMNLFIVGEIEGKNILIIFYWFLFFVMLLTWIYFMLFVHSPNNRKNISFLQIVPLIAIAGLLIFSTAQQFHRYDFFKHEREIFGGKTVEEKNLAQFGSLYHFPRIIQETLKTRHQGKFITDYDLSKSPYMFHHRVLSYFFYPKVSLRLNNKTSMDTLFLYSKKNPLEHIPENYQILIATDDKSFVLAVKKQVSK